MPKKETSEAMLTHLCEIMLEISWGMPIEDYPTYPATPINLIKTFYKNQGVTEESLAGLKLAKK